MVGDMSGRKVFRVVCVLAGLGLMAVAGKALAEVEAQRTVSSDGSMLVPTAAGSSASPAFAGALREGAALDERATFPASSLSAGELAEQRRHYRPKSPPYVHTRTDRALPEAVIEQDRRFRLYARESGFPYRAIGFLTFKQGSFDFFCTGFLISKDTVATAGHCVHEGSGGRWSEDVKFYPAYNNGSAPFGSCGARRLYAVAKWTEDGIEEHDYGAVKLNCQIGETTGWFGYYASAESQVGVSVLLMGYPGDKPRGTMWGGGGDIVASKPRTTHYQIDTSGGQSGSPVIEADRGASKSRCYGTCAVAIHTYAGFDPTNSATRINEAVAASLTAWKNAP